MAQKKPGSFGGGVPVAANRQAIELYSAKYFAACTAGGVIGEFLIFSF